jgi:hypothetical protein
MAIRGSVGVEADCASDCRLGDDAVVDEFERLGEATGVFRRGGDGGVCEVVRLGETAIGISANMSSHIAREKRQSAKKRGSL